MGQTGAARGLYVALGLHFAQVCFTQNRQIPQSNVVVVSLHGFLIIGGMGWGVYIYLKNQPILAMCVSAFLYKGKQH